MSESTVVTRAPALELQGEELPDIRRLRHAEAVVRVPISQIAAGDSPRLRGTDDEHVRLLAGSGATLPPIVVHRPTMRVVDGMHRLLCAKLRGERTVEVRFFEGTDADAFVEAVWGNARHGKPLTLSDRQHAAERILQSHPHWSDRAIARVCSLSSKTIAAIRERSIETVPQLHARIGRDGRVRPLDASAGRQRAAELLAERPDASLREVSVAAGVSPGTVRDVRNRLREGRSPIVTPRHGEVEPAAETPRPSPLEVVAGDVALSSSERGRQLTEWLTQHAVDPADWREFVDAVPVSRVYVVADAARKIANSWADFAEALECRARGR